MALSMTILTKEDYAVTYGYTYNQNGMSDLVFNFIYGCALKDAIDQKAFNCKKKTWAWDVSEAKEKVKKYIDRILSGEFKSDIAKAAHDAAFIQVSNDICNIMNVEISKKGYQRNDGAIAKFCFGNAQKLINMTVKHVYAHTYSLPDMRECFRNCHCPIDQRMLANVWSEHKTLFGKNGLVSNFKSPWGEEGGIGPLTDFPERYKSFQKAIIDIISEKSGDVFPIEYDYIFW